MRRVISWPLSRSLRQVAIVPSCRRGRARSICRQREASQLPLDRKKELADFVVDNSGDLEDSVRQLQEFVSSWNQQN